MNHSQFILLNMARNKEYRNYDISELFRKRSYESNPLLGNHDLLVSLAAKCAYDLARNTSSYYIIGWMRLETAHCLPRLEGCMMKWLQQTVINSVTPVENANQTMVQTRTP
jgi:hypothetical protein